MNESILDALMRLFALVAYVNDRGKPSIDWNVVQEYLQRQFASSLVEKYLLAFNRFLKEYHPDLSLASDDERKEHSIHASKAVTDLCNKLNEELEQDQKVYILIHLLDFIESGSQLSSYQFRFIERVANNLRIPDEEFQNARHFTFDELEKVQNTDNILIINSSEFEKNEAFKHLYIDKMEGRFHVLHLPDTNTLVFRYKGNEDLLLNGHNLKPGRSYIWAPGSVVKNPKFGAIYYIWVAGKFIKKTEETQFIFTANEIAFSYGNSPNGIQPFNLNEESGRLIGIIGGSGSGKSTLLKVLAGVLKPHKGNIQINGFDIFKHAEELKGIIGYIPQDEFLIKELTVYENLFYTAKFSFSQYSENKIHDLVNKALIDFDLEEASRLRVGDSITTFLSGGQRKRLNVALELLREPAVLFVDEPTSGLSSMDSEKVMILLKRQTLKGKLVFANIHQPSSDIFKLLDKLLVVDQGGRVIWYGNPVDAISYLKHANHYVDAETSECLTCGNINAEQILRNVEARVVDVNGKLTRNRKTTPQEWYEMYMRRIDPIIRNIKRPHPEKAPKSNFNAPKRWEQIKLYFRRDLRTKLKNRQYLIVTLLEAPVLALLLAFYTRSSRDLAGNFTEYTFGLNNNIPAFIFMAVIVALFLGLIISAEEIFRDRKLLERERYLNLSRFGYLLSKTAVLFLISGIQMLLFVLISNYILEIKHMNWRYFILLFTAAAWANMIGMNISSGFKSVVTIYILVPLILVPQLLFSGVVVDFQNLNKSIRSNTYVPAIGDAMTSRWVYEALMVTQFKDNRYQKNLFDFEKTISETQYAKAYLIPELQRELEFIENNLSVPDKSEDVRKSLKRILNSLPELGSENSKLIELANSKDILEAYSPLTHEVLNKELLLIRENAHYEYLKAYRAKESALNEALMKPKGVEKLTQLKKDYFNFQLSKLVRNEKELQPYYLYDNLIVKLKDPIYTTPTAQNGRAQYYAPEKRLKNWLIDTFWFNIIVIWLSTIIWFIILYFDLLLKLIKYFENLRLRRFNNRIVRILHMNNQQYNKKEN